VAEVPAGVVTVVSTVPAASGGVVAVIEVDEFTVKLEAAVVPKSTAMAPVKPAPTMVTLSPPRGRPDEGVT
jgi:hypothetical protein